MKDGLNWLKNRIGKIAAGVAVLPLMMMILTVFPATQLQAQANAGVTGTVTDTSGAVIPKANVTIKNSGTGIASHVVTSNVGVYTVTGLVPGHYSIEVEAAGFKKTIQQDVSIDVTNQATINVTMPAGSQSETVEVSASGIELNTTQPQLGTTIEPDVVKALPTEVSGRGRQVDSLQFLTPGTTGSAFSHTVSGGVDFEQEILYNGIPVPQSETEGYTTNYNPPFELVQEFRLERTTFAAQFGLGQGALTYQMSPGTNQFHGDAFEINRNSLFDSKGFFNTKVPTDHENNYGFTVGGPVWIPKVYNGHDRTFFHYSQEWYKQNNENTNFGTVPSPAEKTGDFRDFKGKDAAGNIIVVPIIDTDPTSPTYGQQFSYNGQPNVINPGRISANSAALLPFIPDPDRAGTGPAGLISDKNFVPFINPTIQHNWGFTVDHNLSPSKSLHYSEWRNNFSNFGFDQAPIVLSPTPISSLRFFPARGTVFLLSFADTVTPNLVMTVGAGWIGELNNQYNQNNLASSVAPFSQVAGAVVPPNETFDGQNATTSFGTGGANTGSINRKLGLSLVNNWLWTHGRNTFNIGGEARRTYQDDNEEQTAGGQFNFSQRSTSLTDNTDPNFASYGSSFASFLLGVVDNANRSNSQEERLRNFDLSPYVQDDIKINPKLTVNVGVRWDIMVPFTENKNNIVFLNPTAPNPGAGGLLGAATKFGTCTGCTGWTRADIDWKQFGPRLGFAYQINGKTVVQGGFSIAILNGGAYEYGTNKVAVNMGNLLVGAFNRTKTGSNTPAFGQWDNTQMPNPAATAFNPSLGISNQIDYLQKNYGNAPYAQQWNVNVQRELPYNLFGSVAYIGNRVIHLPSQDNQIQMPNPATYLPNGALLTKSITDPAVVAAGFGLPYPNFVNDFGASATLGQALLPFPQYSNVFNNFEHEGTTFYNSMQAQLEKRFTNGFSFLTSYTLSRLMGTSGSGFSSFVTGGINKYNQKPEWTIDNNDELNNVKISGVYELPIGPNKKYLNHKGIVGEFAGGWQTSWILDYETGNPFGVGEAGSWWTQNGNRPNQVSGQTPKSDYSKEKDFFVHGGTAPNLFNTTAFTPTPNQFTIGNAQRNYPGLRQPAYLIENLSGSKHFTFGEHVKGILQVDYFNAFNRTRFNGPDTNVNDSNYGQAGTGENNSFPNRQGQATFRLEF
jgi:hypothetical protein